MKNKIFKIIFLIFFLIHSFAQAQLASDFDLSLIKSNRQEMTVGIAPGSFDPTTIAHRDLIIESINRLQIDKFVVAVNVMTAKDFNLSVAERIEMTKRSFGAYSDKVIVTERPFDDLNKLAEAVRKAFNGKFYVVLGEDVFEKNYKLLQHIQGSEFAMIPRSDDLAERVDLKLYPRSKSLEISFPGISSSASRDLILKGADPSNILPTEAVKFLQDNQLLHLYPEELNNLRKTIFEHKIANLNLVIKNTFNYSSSEMPLAFKPLQSADAQVEKVVRNFIALNKLSPQESSALRKFALDLSIKNYKNQKVGYFRGSFDPINKEQIEAVEKIITELKLDKMIVAVISQFDNPTAIIENAEVRSELVKIAFRNNAAVQVIIEPSTGSVDTLKLIQKELAAKPIAIFGDNVFEKNYNQLKTIKNLEFAVLKTNKQTSNSKTSLAKYEITVKDFKINSKDHHSVFLEEKSTLTKDVQNVIHEKGYYYKFKADRCSILFAS